MRFTAILLGAFAALAAAQSSGSTTATTASAVTTTAAGSSAQSSQQAAITQCINACQAGDLACTSKCIAVPDPNASQVNATNNCVADCPKGNGTATDNLNYSNCVDGCIGQYYFTTGGTPSATAGSGSGSGTASGTASGSQPTATSGSSGSSGSGSGSGSASASGSGTATGSAPSSSSSKGAGEALRVGGSAAGFFGLVAAILAL